MKNRLALIPVLLALVGSLAACGGSSTAVPSNAIAVVGSVPITIADFNEALKQALAIAEQQGTKPPVGSAQYEAMRNQAVAYLVQVNEVEQQATKEEVSVTEAEITKYIKNIVKTRFDGSEAKFKAELKKEALTMEEARQQVYVNLLAQKLHDKVTKTADVPLSDLKAYYKLNKDSYDVPASTTRSVEHILVKDKTLADHVWQQLKNGANFATLAKKYSKDPGSAAQGGTFTATDGNEVPAYDKVAFALKTGELSRPVDATSAANSSYGWFIIKALGPIKDTKAHTTPFSEAKASIKQILLQREVDNLWSTWLSDLKKSYEGKVHYQASYAPPATTALSTAATLG